MRKDCKVNTYSRHANYVENMNKRSTHLSTESMNDSRSVEESRGSSASKFTTSIDKEAGKGYKDLGTFSNISTSSVKKSNEKLISSREKNVIYGNLRNSNAYDLLPGFLNEDKFPDANSEKELGNEYFKQKKFLDAIDCYSRSIALSPTSAAYANRAMAYLKLKKFEDAEKDCTYTLNLDDRYVKAYSRRAMARKELGKLDEAMEDADFAVRLEPNNADLRKQYSEIKAILETKDCKGNTSNSHVISVENMDKSTTLITEIMHDTRSIGGLKGCYASNLTTSIVKESHGRKHKPELRASMYDLASGVVSQVMDSATKITAIPTSAYEFEVLWRSLSNDSAKQAQLLKTISPSDLPKMFKNALSAHVLIDMIRCIATFFMDDTILAVNFLNSLTNVPRFDMIIMCLSTMNRADMHRLWAEVFLSEQIQGDVKQKLVMLRPKYCYVE